MAYMNQEKKTKIATALKPILAKYKVKGTLRTRQHAITLTLRSGSVDFIQDLKDSWINHIGIEKIDLRKKYQLDINQFHFQNSFEGVSLDFIDEVNEAMQAADYYYNSDIRSDRYDVAYYYDITVGTWQKPYKVIT